MLKSFTVSLRVSSMNLYLKSNLYDWNFIASVSSTSDDNNRWQLLQKSSQLFWQIDFTYSISGNYLTQFQEVFFSFYLLCVIVLFDEMLYSTGKVVVSKLWDVLIPRQVTRTIHHNTLLVCITIFHDDEQWKW